MGFDTGVSGPLLRLVAERDENASTVLNANTGFKR